MGTLPVQPQKPDQAQVRGFPELGIPSWVGPNNKDYRILRSPILGNYQVHASVA